LIAVLDYGIGNLRSAQKALERVGADAHLTDDRAVIDEAAAVVLPGVGAFGRCMEALALTDLDDAAVSAAASGRPFLGICVGMQLLCERSEEDPDHRGLGILRGTVRRLPDGVKRPQMQWNVLEARDPGATLLHDLDDPTWVYFVHSYAPVPDDPSTVVATCDYGGKIVAAIEDGNVHAMQFHPEKSGAAGLGLLRRFVALAAAA
jgi:glutamine amidotransferase